MSNKNILNGVGYLTAVSMALSGCKAVEASKPVDPNEGPTPITSPLPDSIINQSKTLPTFEVCLDKTTQPTAAPTEISINAGGAFSEAQNKVYEQSAGKMDLLKQSIRHWTEDLKLFNAENVVDYKLVFDDPDPNKVTVAGALAGVRDPQTNNVIYYTVAAGDFGNPEVVNKPPIEITAGDDQHILGFKSMEGQGETFIRIDQQGKVTEFVDKRTGLWTEVDNFADLSICRTWREAEKCPITENDFKRVSQFVKANFKFPEEALKLSDSSIYFSGSNLPDTVIFLAAAEGSPSPPKVKNIVEYMKTKVFNTSLSPIGEPYFFSLSISPPRVKVPILVAVYPVNNADGSLGTYTIFEPPLIYPRDPKLAEKWNKISREAMFERMIYSPPIATLTRGYYSNYGESLQGDIVVEVLNDYSNTNGIRNKLFMDFVKTGIVPAEMEEIPFFGDSISEDRSATNPWLK